MSANAAPWWRRVRYQAYGVLLLALILGLMAVAVGSCLQVFSSGVSAQVQANRSGLLLEKGADVTMRGVVVGQVRSVALEQGHAVIKVSLQHGKVGKIPANVSAQIIAPTVFGAKYVDLVPPRSPSSAHIESGAVIAPTAVAIETNSVLENLNTLLQAVDPAKVYSILGTLSTALSGRGQELGQTILSTNELTESLDRNLGALQDDLRLTAPVTDAYAQASPALLRILTNLATTSDTLVATQGELRDSLTAATGLAGRAQSVLAQNQNGLVQLLTTLRPTASALQTYSPELGCLITSTNELREKISPILGGDNPGLDLFASLLPGAAGYDPVKDAPQLDTIDGPDCLGGPVEPTTVNGTQMPALTNGTVVDPYPRISLHDGTNTPFSNKTDCLSVVGVNTCASGAEALTSTLTNLLGNVLP
ncbi:MAG TPA: MCE family protein [Mycobacteriales bacterium]|nr:MCE family protein [Mycobacteriales bacterium]